LGVKGISCLGRKGLSYLKGANMFAWGVKSLSCLGNNHVPRGARGLSCLVDMVVPQGKLNPLFPKG